MAMPVQSCRCAPGRTQEYFTPDGAEYVGSLLASEVYQVPTNWLVLPTGVCPPSPSWGGVMSPQSQGTFGGTFGPVQTTGKRGGLTELRSSM